MQEDGLKKRYIFKIFSNIVSGLIGAIFIAIVPKALGPVAFGQFIYLKNFFMEIIGFLDMGSSIAFFTKLSARGARKELIIFYFIYSFLVLFIVLLFIFTIETFEYIEFILPNIPNEYIYMGLFIAFFTWFTQVFIKISDAYALTVSVELIKVGHKIISLLLLLYLVYFTVFNLDSYFYFNFVVFISFFLALTWLFFKKDIFKNILNSQFSILNLTKEFIEYCHPLLVYSIIALTVGIFDIWLLQKMGGSEQTGFYGLAYSLAAICFIFTGAMTPLITREFSKYFEKKDFKNLRKLFSRYIPMLYSLAAYFGVFISMQSDIVLAIFTDEKFVDVYLVLVVMGFYPIHQTYGQLSGSIFYVTGQTKLIRNIAFISQPIGLILSFVFVYLLDFGAVGLAIKMIIWQVMVVNIQLYFNAKFLNLKIMHFILHQIYAIIFFVVLAYLSTSIISFESPLVYFLASGFLYTIFVAIFTYIFPKVFSTTREEIDEVYIKVRKKILLKIKDTNG